jgi:hypothetical protein
MMKSFEDLTFELLDHKETLDAAIREYDRAVNQVRKKNQKGTIIVLTFVAVAIGCFAFALHNGSSFLYNDKLLKNPLTWVGMVCLLIALSMARSLYQRISRFSIEEKRLRLKREAITEKYAEMMNELDKLRAYNKKIGSKPPTTH